MRMRAQVGFPRLGRALYGSAWLSSLRDAMRCNEPPAVRRIWSNWYVRTALHVVLIAPCLIAHHEGLLRPDERKQQAIMTCLMVAAIELLADRESACAPFDVRPAAARPAAGCADGASSEARQLALRTARRS